MKARSIQLLFVVAAMGIFIINCGSSGMAESPGMQPSASAAAAQSDWFFHTLVDAEFVKTHISIPMSPDVMLIDARPKKAKYDKGHIPMAVSIPHTEFDRHLDKLPANKDTLLIYYCGGLKCKLSHKSATKAEKLGYTNVKVFAEGFPQWMEMEGHYAAVSSHWIRDQLTQHTPMLLIDSRPKRTKFDKGHIPGAISIPDTQFEKHAGILPGDKSIPLIFYCGGLKCKLSHKSAAKAIALGHTNVKVFAEGFPSWKAAVATWNREMPEMPSAARDLKAGKEEGSIDIALFKEIVAQRPQSVHLIDVRDADEFSHGSLETAINIPVEHLEPRIKTLPSDKPIVFICGTGARSGESFYMLQDLRPELKQVYYLDAELNLHGDGSFEIKKIN